MTTPEVFDYANGKHLADLLREWRDQRYERITGCDTELCLGEEHALWFVWEIAWTFFKPEAEHLGTFDEAIMRKLKVTEDMVTDWKGSGTHHSRIGMCVVRPTVNVIGSLRI